MRISVRSSLRATKSVMCGIAAAAAITVGGIGMQSASTVGGGAALMFLYDSVSNSAEARPGGRAGRSAHRRHHRRHRGTPPKASPRRKHRYEHHERAERRHRHRRRVVRRRHVLGFLYVATLPTGCATIVTVDGVRYYHCGGVYYRPYVDNGTTIYVIRES